jgi:hypothetical protein
VPEVYQELLKLLDCKLTGAKAYFDVKLSNSDDKTSVYLTCKDYDSKKGVASQLNRQEEIDNTAKSYYVKGPMGMGLSIDLNGHNIVFAGGTGILVFLDLVAKLVLHNCNMDFEKSENVPTELQDLSVNNQILAQET